MLTRIVFATIATLAKGGRTRSLYLVKPRVQARLRPAAAWLARSGATANQVTVMTCCLSIAAGLLALHSRQMLLLFPAFLVLRMALNAIDGMLARDFGQKSDLGIYLNELGDTVSDAFLYLPFAYQPEFDSFWMCAVIVLSVLCELAGVIAPMTGVRRRYEGPMGKSDRALVFGVIALWLGAGQDLTVWEARLFPQLMALLLVFTIINRVRGGLAESAAMIPLSK